MASSRWTVSVKGVLIWDGHVLLVHNERDEWELPGGRLEKGEQPTDCVVRELAEETGLVAHADRIVDSWVYEPLPGQHVLIVTYGCGADRPVELVHSAEHDDVCLANIDALEDLAMPEGYKASIRRWQATLSAQAGS